jgi:hypothetical protein
MDKPEAKDHVTKNVLDYISAADYINEVLGYDQRDVAGKFANGHCSDAEYQDYWHYVMDALFDNFCNDSFVRYGPYSFSSFAEQTEKKFGADNWRTKIARVWASEYPGEYEIYMSW